jgi:PAS domain S-box-containing protein
MNSRPSVDPSELTFLAGGGEMGARMRELNWSATAPGPPAAWPQSLRSTVSMLLPSKAQIALFWGPEFVLLYNDAYRPVLGAKHPSALGRPGREAWQEIWNGQLRALLEGVVHSGEAFWARDLLFVLERHGFTEDTYFDVSYDPVRVESGAVGGVFCIVTETTERVVGERRLALLRDLAARNATARTERDACLLAIETLAASPDIGFAFAYVGDELQAATPDAEQRLAETGPHLVKTLPLPSSSGGREGRLVVGINPRRPFDDGYRSFVTLVADQLAIALTNARAYEAERQRAEALAEIDRAKTTFFSNVSHEFRTPLTLLVGPLEDELKDADALPSVRRERIETAHRNALRLLRLVNSLLDFSRLEAGRIDASYEPTDLAALTADLASAFRSAIEKAGVAFVVDTPPLSEPVHVDRDMWEKIVLNLLSNAFKFTFDGEIRVELRGHDEHVELRVGDTGVGIPEKDLDRVFERFHRVKHARARTHEGTGIGLALVQELARLHGGTVTVSSEEGRGTTFTVSVRRGISHLPAARIAAPRQLASTSVGATPFVEEALRWGPGSSRVGAPIDAASVTGVAGVSATGDAKTPARILIVDDNSDMRDYLARILEQHYRVEVAGDGGEALERIRADAPELVLADVMMPTLDGFGLVAAVRGDVLTRSMPIVLLSARAGEEARIEGLAAGADEYLVKPFSARELIASVASQLQLARVRRESELAYKQASAARAYLAAIVDSADDAIISKDLDGVIQSCNDAAGRLFGYSPGELVGQSVRILIPSDRQSEEDEILARLRRGERLQHFETVRVTKDGRRLDLSLTISPVRDDHGNIIGASKIGRDITAVKRAEAERLRLIEEASRLKDEFLASLSHELRTPLNAILGYARMLQSGVIAPENRQKAFDTIERNATSLTQIVEDVLDISRIVSGKIRLNVQPVDFPPIVSNAIEAIAPAAEAKGVQLETVLDPQAAPISGDPERLQQIIWNLLSNAVKFTKRGDKVQVRLERVESHIELAVSDTGIGIPAEFLPHVFERFRQAEGGTTRERGGLGLGLSIARQLAEMHGGTIEASSAGLGLGATFRVKIPLMAVLPIRDALPRVQPRAPSAPSKIAAVALNGIHVLAVDDEPDALALVCEVLQSVDARVTTARSAEEALAALGADRPHVVVADLGMPHMDGFEFIERIRRHPNSKVRGIPAAALTAYARSEDRIKALKLGFQIHLAKPIDPVELVTTVAVLAKSIVVTTPDE